MKNILVTGGARPHRQAKLWRASWFKKAYTD